jgi:hypothetical protein
MAATQSTYLGGKAQRDGVSDAKQSREEDRGSKRLVGILPAQGGAGVLILKKLRLALDQSVFITN